MKRLFIVGIVVVACLILASAVFGHQVRHIDHKDIFHFVRERFNNPEFGEYSYTSRHKSSCTVEMPAIIVMSNDDFTEWMAARNEEKYEDLCRWMGWDTAHEWWIDASLNVIGLFGEDTPDKIFIRAINNVIEMNACIAHELTHFMQYYCSVVFRLEDHTMYILSEAEAERMEADFIKLFFPKRRVE